MYEKKKNFLNFDNHLEYYRQQQKNWRKGKENFFFFLICLQQLDFYLQKQHNKADDNKNTIRTLHTEHNSILSPRKNVFTTVIPDGRTDEEVGWRGWGGWMSATDAPHIAVFTESLFINQQHHIFFCNHHRHFYINR